MFEELIGKNVKCVWMDNGLSKAITGLMIKVNDPDFNKLFIRIKGEADNIPLNISINSIVTFKEKGSTINMVKSH